MSARAKTMVVGVICFLAGALAIQTFSNLHAQPATTTPPAAEVKTPKFQHGMILGARHPAGRAFSDARRYGVEVFRDENNGNLIYISDTGSIAVIQDRAAPPK
jgi:hypothetical protein